MADSTTSTNPFGAQINKSEEGAMKKLYELSPLRMSPLNDPKPVHMDPPKASGSLEEAFETWSPIGGDTESPIAKASFGASFRTTRPPPPISKDPRMSMVASTKRLSFSSMTSRRTIKYGKGKFSGVELVPQPSDDSEDPLNWPTWRKNLNFVALLYMSGLVNAMKTVFVSVNSDIAATNGVSYTAAASLTAVPLMISALTGMICMTMVRVYGKRPIYLVSTLALFIGVVWGVFVRNSFGQNMGARVFQGLGWGAFDTLVLGSLQDTFFEHELDVRLVSLHMVSTLSLWGAPLLGSIASASSISFALQFQILSAFISFGMLLVASGVPETPYDRAPWSTSIPTSTSRSFGGRRGMYKEIVMNYVSKMQPWSYKVISVDSKLLLQATRAMIAPTSVLLVVSSLLPYAALWSYASSLSLLFSVMPFMLSVQNIGALMAGPFILTAGVTLSLSLGIFSKRFTPRIHLATLAIGLAVSVIGMLGFGVYVEGCMAGQVTSEATSVWELNTGGLNLSFPVVSLLLGFVAAGSLLFDGTIRPMIQRSTAFTSASLAVGLRNNADMNAGVTCLRNMITGAFIVGVPNGVWMWSGLKSTAMGFGIAEIVLAGAVACIWWIWEEDVRRLDGRVMGLVDLSGINKQGSFFDLS